jgi:uncharacterized protein Veg
MINKIRDDIKKKKGELHHFRFNGARNQIEEFDGIITETYNFVFTIKIINNHEEIKSFTYSDLYIENLEIVK